MRTLTSVICVLMLLSVAGTVYAELQNVEVGGEVRIRFRHWGGSWDGARVARYSALSTAGRPLGPFGVTSQYDWDKSGSDRNYVEQKTALTLRACFTDEVSAFMQLTDFTVWSEDFRSNYITGADNRAATGDDVEFTQAYIQADNMYGMPLSLRVGRQDIVFDGGWLIGNMISPTLPLSFDAIRLTYDTDMVTVDAFWAKLAETFTDDDDTDLYGIHATYKGLDHLTLSGFWYFVRDGFKPNDTNNGALFEWFEDIFEVDHYDQTKLHTVGFALDGGINAIDYVAKGAYQWGETDTTGALFAPFAYGDDDANADTFAFEAEIGYTFDMAMAPRVYFGGAYFGGEDNRDITFLDWLNPLYKPRASVSFNRLFSDDWHSASFDILGGASALTNFSVLRTGVTAKPLEKVTTGLKVAYFWVNEPFKRPASVNLGPVSIPVASVFPFLTDNSDNDIGWLTTVFAKYQYSDDLWVSIGWERIWASQAVEDGNFILKNGLDFMGGTDDDDADYIWMDTQLKF